MSEQPTAPDEQSDDTMGEEPEEESGAGYGNHAPDLTDEPSDGNKDAR